MIKNDIQLKRSERLRTKFVNLVKDAQEKYAGSEYEFIVEPLNDEIERISRDILEYKLLKHFNIREAIESPLFNNVYLENVNSLLVRLRIASGLTQQEMANSLGWEQSNISRFEKEDYQSHTIVKVLEYASALGVRLHIAPSLEEESPDQRVIQSRRYDESVATDNEQPSSLSQRPPILLGDDYDQKDSSLSQSFFQGVTVYHANEEI